MMVEPTTAAAPWHAITFNSGSSSLKFGLYELRAGHPACVVSGDAHGVGEARSVLRVVDPSGRIVWLDPDPLPHLAGSGGAVQPMAC